MLAPGVIRCAVYTRKSSDEGLEQEFNSLDAQREACDAYILSQRHAGWVGVPNPYDDGGLSGGTLERPALKRLLADIAKIVDILDSHRASFVSVTQQFNTTTSMGRLTLNMLLSFAQFEREIAGERISDKIAASKRKGMWMGGNVPLGYDARDRTLVVNAAEAETVRFIFRRYAELGSVALLQADLDRRGIVSKQRPGANGALSGGGYFSRGALYLMLQNRLYRGEVSHKGEIHPGRHAPIIDQALWDIVQEKLDANRVERSLSTKAAAPSLLAGLIYDDRGLAMTPTHAAKQGKRYRYYVSTHRASNDPDDLRRGARYPAGDVEGIVVDALRSFLADPPQTASALAPLDLDARTLAAALANAQNLSQEIIALATPSLLPLLRKMTRRVIVRDDGVRLLLDRAGVADALIGDWKNGGRRSRDTTQGTEEDASNPGTRAIGVKKDAPDATTQADDSGEATTIAEEAALRHAPIFLFVAAKLRRVGKGKTFVIDAAPRVDVDHSLVALFREAVATRDGLLSGDYDSVEDMSRRTGVIKARLVSLVRLFWLAPDILRLVFDGRQPLDWTATKLLTTSKDLPSDWRDQRRFLGLVD